MSKFFIHRPVFAWVLAIVGFPYVAVPAYLMFGTRKLRHARRAVALKQVRNLLWVGVAIVL